MDLMYFWVSVVIVNFKTVLKKFELSTQEPGFGSCGYQYYGAMSIQPPMVAKFTSNKPLNKQMSTFTYLVKFIQFRSLLPQVYSFKEIVSWQSFMMPLAPLATLHSVNYILFWIWLKHKTIKQWRSLNLKT